jgi:hypothetical protein
VETDFPELVRRLKSRHENKGRGSCTTGKKAAKSVGAADKTTTAKKSNKPRQSATTSRKPRPKKNQGETGTILKYLRPTSESASSSSHFNTCECGQCFECLFAANSLCYRPNAAHETHETPLFDDYQQLAMQSSPMMRLEAEEAYRAPGIPPPSSASSVSSSVKDKEKHETSFSDDYRLDGIMSPYGNLDALHHLASDGGNNGSYIMSPSPVVDSKKRTLTSHLVFSPPISVFHASADSDTPTSFFSPAAEGDPRRATLEFFPAEVDARLAAAMREAEDYTLRMMRVEGDSVEKRKRQKRTHRSPGKENEHPQETDECEDLNETFPLKALCDPLKRSVTESSTSSEFTDLALSLFHDSPVPDKKLLSVYSSINYPSSDVDRCGE